MEVTIVVASYNTKELTVGCLKSIARAKVGLKYEVIVVDNGSKDGTVEAIRRLKIAIDNLIVIENVENLGFARANNQGISKAKGRYVLLLNSDTEVKRGAIEKLREFAEEKPDVGVVGARLLNADGTMQESVFRLPTLGRTVKQYWFGQKGVLDKYVPGGENPVEVEAVVGAAFMITPEAIKKVGKLDERYFMFFEDLDYCRRARRAGLGLWYLPEAEVVHYHGKSGKGTGKSENQWRRLIRSSKIYHGLIMHYLVWFVMWSGQKLRGA